MPDVILQSEATPALRESLVRLVDASGAGLAGMGGGTAAIKISKPGTAVFSAAGAGTAITEVTGGTSTGGMYRLVLGATDADAVGDVGFEISHASINGGAAYGVISVKPALRAVDLADGALLAAKFADGAFTSAKFADAFLTAAKIASGAIEASFDATPIAAALVNFVIDADAPEGLQKLSEILNVLASYVAADADGFAPGLASQLSYKKTGRDEARLVGSISGGKRKITKADGR